MLHIVVFAVVLGLLLGAASPAVAVRAANYGYDWTGHPTYDFDLFGAAERSAYYQELAGYTTMNRDHGLGTNIWDKLSGDDPATYDVINVISHGNSQWVNASPDPGSLTYYSCIYSRDTAWGPHDHSPTGTYWYDCGAFARLQKLTSVPSVRWLVLQSCESAALDGAPSSPASEAYQRGVDVTVGFYHDINFGGAAGSDNQHSYQYNFAARYWKSLYENSVNSAAIDDGAAQVLLYHDSYGGYDDHARYGPDIQL